MFYGNLLEDDNHIVDKGTKINYSKNEISQLIELNI